MYIYEVALHKELMDCVCNQGAYAEDCLERVRARTKMRHRAQIIKRVALLLHRIIRRGCSFDLDSIRLDLERLLCLRCGNQGACNDNRGTYIQLADFREIVHLVMEDDL